MSDKDKKWGPDVEEVREQNRRSCRHERTGTCHRNEGAGWPRIGCRRVSYEGCLDCGKDLSAQRLLERVLKENPDFGKRPDATASPAGTETGGKRDGK